MIETKEMFRMQGNFLSKSGSGSFMERCKGKDVFIEDYIT
jgi:hypothetical protein